MPRSIFQSICALVVSLAFGVFAIQNSLKNEKQAGARMPQGVTQQIYATLLKMTSDLEDPQVFNRNSAIAYIKNLTEAAYSLGTDDLYPNTSEEKKKFDETRKDWMEKLFDIQLKLRSKMFKFHAEKPLEEPLIAAFRNANMYLSYAQDFVLLEWAVDQNLSTKPMMFSKEFPVTQLNPKFSSTELKGGDIILVRGDSAVSATIARTGDYVTNFSHTAMVIQTPNGTLQVAEALLDKDLVVYSMEKYLSLEKLSRATVLRPQNPADGKAAALAGFKIIDDDLKAPVRKVFDFMMNPNSPEKIYCFELIRMAYIEGTKGRIDPPAFPMTFRKALAENIFYQKMGSNVEIGAAPDDAFFQPEFDVVMVQRDIGKLKSDWAYDVAVSALFDFMSDKYDYKPKLVAQVKANFGFYLKQFLGEKFKKVPHGASVEVIQLMVEHRVIVDQIQKHLVKLMEANHRVLAYKELEVKAHEYLKANQDEFFVSCKTTRGTKAGSCRSKFQ